MLQAGIMATTFSIFICPPVIETPPAETPAAIEFGL
jgi:hypothetical protein